MLAARVLRSSAPRITAANARPLTTPILINQARSRGYAEASQGGGSQSSANTRPPVELFGVDGTYASATYTAAAKQSTLDATVNALSRLHRTFTQDPKLQTIMQAPTLTDKDKAELVKELLKTANVQESSKEGATVKGLLNTLSDNNRFSILDGVCEKFAVLMSAARGEVEMKVTSAEELDKKVLQRLEQAVSKSRFVGQGKKLKVVPTVQPDIRGGLIVEIGDRTIDLSVSGPSAEKGHDWKLEEWLGQSIVEAFSKAT